MDKSEAILIKRCQSGCSESFDLLYRKHHSAVLRIARKIMKDEQDADVAASLDDIMEIDDSKQQ